MTTVTVIFYRQYGRWCCTMPFPTRGKAESHADLYLRSDEIKTPDGKVIARNMRDHIKDITFVDVELPE